MEVVCVLSNGYVADDLGRSLTPNHPNFCIFRRLSFFVVGECRDFKFGTQIDHN